MTKLKVAYGLLTAALVASRLVGLRQGFWNDEAYSIGEYASRGPDSIFFGHYLPNNHMLFNLLAWIAYAPGARAEIVMRLFSVVPFLLGVGLLAGWAHRRFAPAAGLALLVMLTASPMLFDLSRQARGYGLAFFAAVCLVVAADRALSTRRTRYLVAIGAAGLVGSWTLPVFAVAFAAVLLALIVEHDLRGRVLVLSAVAAPAIALWYLPVLDDLIAQSGQHFGAPVGWHGVVSGPVVHLLAPTVGPLGVVPATLALFALAVRRRAMLLRKPSTFTLVLAGPIILTFAFLAVTQMWVAPRFVSYLAVPLLVAIAVGCADLVALSKARGRPRRPLVVAVAAVALSAFAAQALAVTAAAALLPYEAIKDASLLAVAARPDPAAPIFVQASRPRTFRYYLAGAGALYVNAERGEALRCAALPMGAVFVFQPYRARPVSDRCLIARGAAHHRFSQSGRGGYIDVWLIPRRSAS